MNIKNKNTILILLLPLAALILPILLMFISIVLSEDFKLANYWLSGLLVRTIVLIIMIGYILHVFIQHVVKQKQFSNRFTNFLTAYYFFFVLIMILEFGTTFIVKTNPTDVALSSRNWHLLYWYPINSSMYRDEEFTMKKDKLAVFLGDSFTAGYGIKNYKDRFSNIVESNSEYETWNFSAPGWDTKSEISAITFTKYAPDIFYIQFYFNDIIGSGYKFNRSFVGAKKPNYIEKSILMSTYLGNTIYCMNQDGLKSKDDYIDFLNGLVLDKEVWTDYSQDILSINRLCDSLHSEFRAIIFPYLKDFEVSRLYVNSLQDILNSLGVPIINVEELIEDILPNNRVVNKLDSHPSVLVNQRVAQKIIKDLAEKDKEDKVLQIN